MHRIFRVSHVDFTRLLKEKPRRTHGEYFTLLSFLLPESTNGPKVACVVSKKVAARSVARNRIKRRCRECLKRTSSIMDTRKTYVFYAKKSAIEATFVDIQSDIDSLIKK